jgi:hypothetical protein
MDPGSYNNNNNNNKKERKKLVVLPFFVAISFAKWKTMFFLNRYRKIFELINKEI